ncbi:metallophosphoesterase family protein [Rubritalea tangerina]|uniref:Metallophosphoesterase family protein n=2 Tax=Rubritalea tangerina TaxID=430798 RepID=A0ABW4ZCD6_9BACT
MKPLNKSITLGIITDVHIGFVSEAEKRLDAFLKEMKKERPDALVQLGDFAFPNAKYQAHADRFNAAHEHTIHAIGNHELDHGLTRDSAVKAWGIPGYYYSKEVEGIKIIVLDGNDRGSPTYSSHGGYHSYIGPEQQAWLKKELDAAEQPVLIASHQPLAGTIAVDNAQEMQELLSHYQDKILLCINGHSHVDQQLEVKGIHYLHINSASYYWLGGRVRLATYKDPLFTTMTIDPKAATITLKGVKSSWAKGTPEDAGYFKDGKHADKKDIVRPEIRARRFAQVTALTDLSGKVLLPVRQWINKEGKKIQASLIAQGGTLEKPIVIKNGKVCLKVGKKNHLFPLTDLSPEDQKRIKKLQR